MRSHPEQTTSPPLMVHAVRAGGPGTGGVGGHSGRAPGTASTRSPEDVADSPDGAARLPAPCAGDRTSLPQIRGPKRTRSGTAGTRSLRPSFSAPSWPPGARSRRLGSGRARLGLCPDRELGAGSPALRPLRTGPPAVSPRCGPHAARAHTMPARGVRSAPPAGAFTLRGARSSSLCSEKGAWKGVRRPGGSRLRGRSRAAYRVRGPAARTGASPGVGEVAGPRQEGGSAHQPRMRAGISAGTKLRAALLWGGTPLSRPLRSSPTPGARGGFGEARPGLQPSSFWPFCLPFPRSVASSFCPDFL